MTTNEARRYEMLARVREFGEAHRDRFPEGSAGGDAFAAVATAVQQLSAHAVSKLLTATEGRMRKRRAREELNDQLEAIARTARVLAAATPGLGETLQLRKKQTDSAFLATGRAFAQHAPAFESQFVRHGLPETFIADLNYCVETFAQAIRHREVGREGQTAARASIAAALSAGMAATRTLDVVVANQLHDEPVVMAVWKHDRRIEYPPRGKKAAPAEPTPAPPAEPTKPGGVGSDAGIGS